jgi:hypothetical protein
MDYTKRQEAIYTTLLQGADPHYWHDESIAEDMAPFLQDPYRLGPLLAMAKKQGIDTFILQAGWKQAQHFNGAVPPVGKSVPVSPIDLAPELPKEARLPPRLAIGAAGWLEDYCAHSRFWAPRAADGFHQAVGLWMLSTISARRVCVHLGKPEFPMLFLTMVAPSTLYTKTTTAHIARRALRQAGCQFLLTPDRITPQALIRRMSGRVEDDYSVLDQEQKDIKRRELAFAGQRGWYYEEWGGMLQQIRRHDSVMSDFHGTLRVLDDGADDFSNETIMRGLEHVVDPSLALLCSATPADLAPYMRPGANWWQDGFWPRFAFITPRTDEPPSLADQPPGLDTLPAALVEPLHRWHARLGEPKCTIEPMYDSEGKPSGRWKADRRPFAPHVLGMPAEVLKAYNTYNKALLTLIIENRTSQDVKGCYGRFHAKALRVAILLASLEGCADIEMRHWAYAQHIAETWRNMLHHLLVIAAESEPKSNEQLWEEKIESLLSVHGPMTARELQRHLFRCPASALKNVLASMAAIGRIVMMPKGKTMLYLVPMDAPPAEVEDVEEVGRDEE